jgi:DNA transformation protein and related proteins
MAQRNEFIEYLLELLQGVGKGAGSIRARAMFGGFGLYFHDTLNRDSFMFALVADEVLYFKTDEYTQPAFEEHGLCTFTYERNGKRFSMSYSEAPGEVLDDPDAMTDWANKAIDAAKRSAAKKAANRKHPRTPPR